MMNTREYIALAAAPDSCVAQAITPPKALLICRSERSMASRKMAFILVWRLTLFVLIYGASLLQCDLSWSSIFSGQ